MFVSLVAPKIFSGYWELHLAFVVLAGLLSFQIWRQFRPRFQIRPANWLPLAGAIIWIAAVGTMIVSLQHHMQDSESSAIATSRGFYGVLQVSGKNEGTEDEYRSLYHGRISHGRQYTNEEYRDLATTYYSLDSGVGAVFELLPENRENPSESLHVGVIGLGVGTIATYAEKGDRFRLYEINPQVEMLARKHFTYLADCKGSEKVVLGDARISLERELAEGENQQFDALSVDAFSGDSIPIHLLTREAFSLYFEHLKPDGVLAVHITNLHLDLADPVRNQARLFDRSAVRVDHVPDLDMYHCYYSDWILISKNPNFLSALNSSNFPSEWDREKPEDILWTDDYSNLFEVAL
jgi:hypothetical protein